MSQKFISRRRVPRRLFSAKVGLLIFGEYDLGVGLELGEGGMLVSSPRPLSIEQRTVVTFQIPGSIMLVLRGVVRYILEPDADHRVQRFGIQFDKVEFEEKRHIRNFVAAKTEFEKIYT